MNLHVEPMEYLRHFLIPVIYQSLTLVYLAYIHHVKFPIETASESNTCPLCEINGSIHFCINTIISRRIRPPHVQFPPRLQHPFYAQILRPSLVISVFFSKDLSDASIITDVKPFSIPHFTKSTLVPWSKWSTTGTLALLPKYFPKAKASSTPISGECFSAQAKITG